MHQLSSNGGHGVSRVDVVGPEPKKSPGFF